MKTRERGKKKGESNNEMAVQTYTHFDLWHLCTSAAQRELKDSQRKKGAENTWSMRKMLPVTDHRRRERSRTHTKRIYFCIYCNFFLILLFLRLMYFLRGVWKHCKINCEWKVRCHHRSMLWASTSLLCAVQSVSFGECVCLCVLRSMYRIVQSTESFSSEWIKPSVYDL